MGMENIPCYRKCINCQGGQTFLFFLPRAVVLKGPIYPYVYYFKREQSLLS